MQNFTLGKKGISMLFFAFILLIGSSPSFGQCPTPGNTSSTQTFCYLATVGDIATDGSAVYQTSNNTTDTQPIRSTQILDDQATYYVGGQSGSCARLPVKVTVNSTTFPDNNVFPGENSFTISPCTDNFTAEQLATYFDPISGYEIRVYTQEFGNAQATGPLTPNDSYFVGQVSQTPTSTPDNCPSFRVSVGYDPAPAPAPTATSPQTYCESATVADLQAQGTSPNTQAIRWYRTATSFEQLSSNTILIDGETYYATQVINDRNSPLPPCESKDRTPVTVTIQPATFNETTQSFCASVGTGNNFRMPQVQDLEPQGGTFYAESNSADPLDPNTDLVDGDDYFNRATGDDCTQDRITVVFKDTPNAGSTTQTTTCENETPFNLVDRINNSQLGAPDRDGTFSPALSTGTQIFNPADYSPGKTYTFNYNVVSGSSCPDDTAVISIEVQAAPNAGPDQTLEFCQNEVETIINLAFTDPAAAQALLAQRITNADLNGSFPSNDIQAIALGYLNAVNTNSFPYNASTVYTVDNANCSDTANIGIVVFESPYAGDDASIEVDRTDAPFNLYDVLVANSSATPDTNGTFSPGNAKGDFDPATANAGTYRYTVTNTNGCQDFADINVTILEDLGCPDVTESTQSFCESISDPDGNNPRRPRVLELSPQEATWYATADSDTPIPGNTILVNGNTYYAGNTNGTCNARMPVLVNIDNAPNAGSTTILNVCSSEAPFNISSRMNPSILGAADAGGSITPALASGTDLFDPAVDKAIRYTYRFGSQNSGCADDTAFVTINITDPIDANAGKDVTLTFCSTDGIQNLNDKLASDAYPGGAFSGLTNGQFDPSTATVGENTIITYTVDNRISCVSGTDAATYTINVLQGPNAGQNGAVTFSNKQVGTFNLFSYLQGNPSTGGTWTPGNADGSYSPEGKTAGTYIFTYKVTNNNDCTASAEVAVTITDDVIICPEVADTTQEFCETVSDANGNNPRRPQVKDLKPSDATWYSSAISTDALAATAVLVNGDYFAGNPNATCTSRGKVSVIIDVSPNAGSTTIINVCSDEAAFDIVPLLNESILGKADAGGTFSPALASGTTIFDPAVDVAIRYTYRVISDNSVCPDDTTFVTINISDPVPANAGGAVTLNFCSNEDVQNLYNFIGTSGNTMGSFDGLTDGLFNPSENVGTTTTVIYTVDDTVACTTGTDTAIFTIKVTEPQDANAGDDITASYCVDQTDNVDLRSLLPEAIRTRGSFSAPYQDGIFNPSETVENVVNITYSINGAEDCAIGTDEATITITVNGVSDAPVADAEQTFCFIDHPTVADLSATGENIVWYEDATLLVVAENTDPLVTGEDYYAVATAGSDSCRSAAAKVTVAINDSNAPTLQFEGNKFCRQDNPTIQDLLNNVTGGSVKIYMAVTGGTAVTNSTVLVNGMTYYATSTNSDFGCESSERLAIVANVEFCGIPEGFSPNGDGINDRFVIPDIAIDYPNYTIEIFNRWGQVVFEGNVSTPDWDGVSNRKTTLGNDVLPVGVYFYILKYNDGVTAPVQGKLYLSR